MYIRPLDQQEPNESRNLWKNVTLALYNNDVQRATFHKDSLENEQRSQAKWRQEKGIEYKAKYFDKSGARSWIYNKRNFIMD